MSTKEIVRLVCDQCKHEGSPDEELEGQPTLRYTIWVGKEQRILDLCETHGAPVRALLVIRTRARYPRVTTARRGRPRRSQTHREGD